MCSSIWLHLEGSVTLYKAILTDHLHPVVKHFCLDSRGLFQEASVPVHEDLMSDLFMHASLILVFLLEM